jgi:mannitol/fructose-specific phosphotransferase system IIA component (Ntr-type)
MNLLELLPESRLIMDLNARDQKAAVREIVQHLVTSEVITEDVGKKLEKAVNKREAEGSTAIGKGLAIPHAKECAFLSEVIAVFARSRTGIQFDSTDGGPVHIVFMVVSPVNYSDTHLAVMKKIATMHRDEKTLKFLRTTDRVESVIEILKEIDEGFK